MLVAFTGKAGAGKTTLGKYLEEKGFEMFAFASPLKQMLKSAGIDEPAAEDKNTPYIGKGYSFRQAAQTLGDWGRNLDPNFWVNLIADDLKLAFDVDVEGSSHNIVIHDLRFEQEAEMVRKLGGTVIHLLGRQANLGEAAQHVSEIGVMFYPAADKLIDASGTVEQACAQLDNLLTGLAVGEVE